ncbi:hypothetical protein NQZ68_015577 [Dissostichus eleginoides]|nr:hypothetical protein NQZ68_015577 [Dissostichus eleginoides]
MIALETDKCAGSNQACQLTQAPSISGGAKQRETELSMKTSRLSREDGALMDPPEYCSCQGGHPLKHEEKLGTVGI